MNICFYWGGVYRVHVIKERSNYFVIVQRHNLVEDFRATQTLSPYATMHNLEQILAQLAHTVEQAVTAARLGEHQQ